MPQPDRLLWRSDFGWSPHSPAATADPKSGLVIHYDSTDQRLADKPHAECLAYWKRTRSFHTGPARGWADIGYSFMACAHGYVLEGRGLWKVQAAQPGGNSSYYSVTLATGPTDRITPEQINAVRQLREWLMEPTSSIAGTVKGHRDFISTSCPGDKAYALVRNGTFTKPATWGGAAPASSSTVQQGDDMPQYLSMAHTKDVTIAPGKYVSLRWDSVWTDDAKTAHDGGLAFMSKRGQWNGALWLELEGLKRGDDVHVRVAEYTRSSKKYKLHPHAEGIGTDGKSYPVVPLSGYIGDGRTADLRVYNVQPYPITVRRATVKAQVWAQ